MHFADRVDAGRQLAPLVAALDLPAQRWGEGPRPIPVLVLGLPRGGVVVAAEVAAALGTELDVLVVRKVAMPARPELAVGAIAEGLPGVVPSVVAGELGIGPDELERLAAPARVELDRRAASYRAGRLRPDRPDLAGRVVVLVDDGLATGATAEAAARSARAGGAARIVLAVPVAAPDAAGRLRRVVDDLVTVRQPWSLGAVGAAYEDFRPTTDDEVLSLLTTAAPKRGI